MDVLTKLRVRSKNPHENRRPSVDEKVFFLADEPKEDLSQDDAFGHAYYARTLLQILENTRMAESYAIGLFGKWGVGKTSIINELERIINERSATKGNPTRHSYTLLKLDVWEYSEHNFRREFLLDLGAAFSCQGYVRDRLTSKKVAEIKAPSSRKLSWLMRLGGPAAIFFIFWVLAFFLAYAIVNLSSPGQPSWFQPFITSLVVAAITAVMAYFQDYVREVFKPPTIIQEIQPAVHPDEFKEIFRYIVREKANLSKKNGRLVIVLDNLDRVKEEIVIAVLGAIKTFLREENCIYILPCDDKGLKQHIIHMRSRQDWPPGMTETEATEYLRKFFQTTLVVRDFLTEDLEAFTDHILAQMQVFDSPITNSNDPDQTVKLQQENRNEVGLVMRVAVARNPRRIIQLANKLSANYLLTMEKGEIDPRFRDSILCNLGFLAKVTVLEEEWPNFYNLIIKHPDVVRQLRNYFITEQEEHLPRTLRNVLADHKNYNYSDIKYEWEHGLEDFLRRTSTIHSDRVSDFLLFKQRPSVALIADYYTFYDAALTSDAETVVEIIRC